MSGTYWDAEAQCPFFRRADRKSGKIWCEGLTQNSSIILQYQDRLGFDVQIRTFCCKNFRCCEIGRAIIEANYAEE